MKTEKFLIAQIGRTVGLHGDLKLNLHTDFPDQFKQGAKFSSDRGVLEVQQYNPKRGTIRFVGYESLESAKPLTNVKLYSTQEQTQKNIELNEGEYFWFDIIGSAVVEDGTILGKVEEIDRMLDVDYLSIATDSKLVEEGMPKSFLLPYIPRYIVKFDIEAKEIHTLDARDVLEAS